MRADLGSIQSKFGEEWAIFLGVVSCVSSQPARQTDRHRLDPRSFVIAHSVSGDRCTLVHSAVRVRLSVGDKSENCEDGERSVVTIGSL